MEFFRVKMAFPWASVLGPRQAPLNPPHGREVPDKPHALATSNSTLCYK